MSGRRRAYGRCVGLALLCLALPACRPGAERDLLAEAYALAQEGRWEAVLPLAKAYLVAHPLDASGHWLLGQGYANAMPPAYALAVGELEVALALERAAGDLGGLRDTVDRRDFEFSVYRETALAQIGWVVHARDIGVPPAMVVPRLYEAMEAVNKGLEIDANAELLLRLKERIQFFLDRDGHLDPRLNPARYELAV